ncbi:ABC transporter substrate-binding protein [filamentous cyanobacterium CCP2]|nr:ABC transporter substrate-binding protein [filamentous cyanobacterium CCP2]
MKRRHLFFSLGMAASFAVSLIAGCGNPQSSGAGQEGARTLTAVTSADYPPFEFFETADGQGEPVGFDIDLANYIADELGYELTIVDMDFNGIIPALQSGRADFAIAGMTVTEERLQSVDFSDPYHEIVNALVVQKDSGITGFEDLDGQRVGVQLGSTQEKVAQNQLEKFPGMTIDSRNRVNEIIQEIKAGNMAAGVVALSVAQGFINNNPDLDIVTIPDQESLSVAMAFPKDSELVSEFNQVLAEMQQNGTMDELTKKWFEDYYANQTDAEG